MTSRINGEPTAKKKKDTKTKSIEEAGETASNEGNFEVLKMISAQHSSYNGKN